MSDKKEINWEAKFLQYKQNIYPAMADVLAEQLGVTVESINKLEIGFLPGEQAWIFPERNTHGNVVGLTRRYHNGKKFMVHGSKRGLIYECVGTINKKETNKQYNKFIRCYTAGVDCPMCGKRKWCMVSDDNPKNPTAVICGHTSKGAIKHIENSGYLHIRHAHQSNQKMSPLRSSDKPIIVVEGASDVLAAMDMGYVAVGKPNADSRVDWLSELLKGKDVVVVGENDEAGRRGMQKTFDSLRSYCDSIQKVLPPAKYKDLRAWHPTADEFEQWLQEKADVADNSSIIDDIDYMALAETWLKEQSQRIVWHDDDWYQYNGAYYQKIKRQWIEKHLRDFFRHYEFARWVNNVKTVKPLQINKKFIEEMRLALQSICYIDVPKGVCEPFYIGKKVRLDLSRSVLFDGGLYHVLDDKFEPTTSEIFATTVLPYKYNPKTKCPQWEWFVQDVFNGDMQSVNLLQEWFGYNLIASNHMEQMLFLFGVPGSGKSTTIDVLQAVIGADRCCATNIDDFTNQFGLHLLVGKYAAFISEDQVIKRVQAQRALEKIKQITGEDNVRINRKYRDSIAAKLFCRITYAGNELPNFNDEAQAFFRRFNLLYYANNYCDRSPGPDRTLKQKLINEAQGIGNWALEGLRRLLKQGDFTHPRNAKEHIDAMRSLASPLRTMINEWCEFGNDYVESDTLYDLHRAVFDEAGVKPMSRTWFGVRFKNAYPKINKVRKTSGGKRYWAYEGLRVTPEAYERYLGGL